MAEMLIAQTKINVLIEKYLRRISGDSELYIVPCREVHDG